MLIQRAFINLLVEDLAASRAFYERLGYGIRFASDWFVHLAAADEATLELGLMQRNHDLMPAHFRAAPAGLMLTLVVADVDALHAQLQAEGLGVVEAPRDLFYGQRRMLLQAPEGTVLDISSACAPDPSWLARVSQAQDGSHVERAATRHDCD